MIRRPPLPILASVLCAGVAWAAAEEWREVYSRDGVQVMARKVDGLAVNAMRGTMVVDVPVTPLLNVLTDVESYPEIMPPTKSARLLRRDAGGSWYYMVIDPPWVSRRDYCIKITFAHFPDGRVTTDWQVDPTGGDPAGGGCPAPASGTVRMDRNSGRWTLTPKGPSSTTVTYEQLTDPGGSVPTWMVNRSAARTVPDVMNSVKRYAMLPRYARERAGTP